MSEWQPIETAPRDGTWFVIYCAGEEDSYEIGRYEPLMGHDFVEAGRGLYRKVDKELYEWTGFNNFHCATHWLPLPPPPKP